VQAIRNLNRPVESRWVGTAGSGTYTQASVTWSGKTWDKLIKLTNNQCLARYFMNMAFLAPNALYRTSMWIGNQSASSVTAQLDWCDGAATVVTLVPGESRWVTFTASRPSAYDATYRFVDVQLNNPAGEVMLTAGAEVYEFANGDSPGWKWEGVNISSVGTPTLRPFWPNMLTRQRSSFDNGISGIFGLNATLAADSAWADSGSQSVRVTPNGADNNSAAHLVANEINFVKPGGTYTICGTIRLTQPQTVNVHSLRARRITCFAKPTGGTYTEMFSSAAPNAAGVYRIQSVITIPNDAQEFILRAVNGESVGGAPVWWDRLGLFEHNQFGAPPADYWVPGTT
jgi:hypothetical protein